MTLFLLLAFRNNFLGSAKKDEGEDSHDRRSNDSLRPATLTVGAPHTIYSPAACAAGLAVQRPPYSPKVLPRTCSGTTARPSMPTT
jgi:hypothetical protein